MISLAVQTATELMVPEGLEPALWQSLNASGALLAENGGD
jgi:hypothetical protein